jgi:hypothetical protein
VLVGGGTVLGLRYAQGQGYAGQSSASTGASPSPSPAPTSAPETAATPKGWHRVSDPDGFNLMVPDDWTRQVDGAQIDYTPDKGDHFIRISVDRSPDYDSAYHHQKDLETQLSNLPDYQTVQLAANTFRDQSGSLWEFTWTAASSDPFTGPRHAIEQTYFDRQGVEYAIYMSSPDSDWDTTRQQFDEVLRSWWTG